MIEQEDLTKFEYCFWCQRYAVHEFISVDGEVKKGCAIHKARYEMKQEKLQ